MQPAPLIEAPAEDPSASDVYPNCGAERLGEYCQRCGQHYLERGYKPVQIYSPREVTHYGETEGD